MTGTILIWHEHMLQPYGAERTGVRTEHVQDERTAMEICGTVIMLVTVAATKRLNVREKALWQ